MPDVVVVTVPDFAVRPALDEARTNLFLGSWSENAGAARAWQVHVACIGEPPESVRRMADRCGAEISVHDRFGDGGAANKLRAFDAPVSAERMLLVDSDVVTLGDPSALLEAGPGFAGTFTSNNRVSVSDWRRIYARCGETLPTGRMLCLRGRLASDLPPKLPRGHNLEPMPPSHQGGLLWIPGGLATRFSEAWRRNMTNVGALARESGRPADRKLAKSDQTSLAVTLNALAREGIAFHELAPKLHPTWVWFLSGRLSARDALIYHAVGLFAQGDEADRGDPIRQVALHTRKSLRYGASAAGRAETEALGERLRELVARHVVPNVGARPGAGPRILGVGAPRPA